jgi:DNA-binding XRE family transcriptional regulator
MQKIFRGPNEFCEMSQIEVAEKLFLKQQTLSTIERRAMAKFKALLEQRGLKISDLLQD